MLMLVASLPLLAAGIAVASAASLLWGSNHPSPTSKLVADFIEDGLQPQIQISTGPILWTGAGLGSLIADVPKEVRCIIGSIKSADVDIFQVASPTAKDPRASRWESLDLEMQRQGWDGIVNVSKEDLRVRVFLQHPGNSLKDAKLCVLVCSRDEGLVVVSVRADLEKLADSLEDHADLRGLKIAWR